MARLNLTIPDSLYGRLEQLRDRVNVSKICAVALTKELDMIDSATTTSTDAKVQRLIQRFLRQQEFQQLWYLRGRQDGETWAIERASIEELRMFGEEWDESYLEDCESMDEIDMEEYPSFNAHQLLMNWVRSDRSEGGQESGHADWKAYMQGWWHGVRDLWKAAKPSLR